MKYSVNRGVTYADVKLIVALINFPEEPQLSFVMAHWNITAAEVAANSCCHAVHNWKCHLILCFNHLFGDPCSPNLVHHYIFTAVRECTATTALHGSCVIQCERSS
jgi:hypothetical protein